MNLRLRSLLVRLTIAYSLSIFLIIVLFTVGSTLLIRGLAKDLVMRMTVAEKNIDPLLVSLKVQPDNLAQKGPLIEHQLSKEGVLVMVRRMPHPGMSHLGYAAYNHSGFVRDRFNAEAHGMSDMRRSTDIAMSLILDVWPRRYHVAGGEIMILPLPTRLGTPFYLFLAEMCTLGAALILVAGLVGRALTLRGFAPLREVSTALAQLADGEFSPTPVRVSDEIEMGGLATNYNRAVLRASSTIEERERNERRMRQFIADASHELRTPLTVILGYFDALSKPVQVNELAQNFERARPIIAAEGQRMRVLIDNMSLLTKLDQAYVARIEIVDLSDLVAEVVRALSIVAGAGRFVVQAEPGVLITGNREELFAALRNLVENALKYAPDGLITLHSAYEKAEAFVEVADEGPGIAVEDIPHLFTRFYRGEQRGDIAGSGLGLPIVSRAVERAAGTIGVHAVAPHGTRFRLAFPRRDFH